jgi:hypothetical protein
MLLRDARQCYKIRLNLSVPIFRKRAAERYLRSKSTTDFEVTLVFKTLYL